MLRHVANSVFAGILGVACLFASPVSAQFAANDDPVTVFLFNGADESTYKQQIESRTALRLHRIQQVAELEESEFQKLRLAVRGDLNRFYRDLSSAQEKTKKLSIQNQKDMQEAWELIAPLQSRVQDGLLNDESLFHRVLTSTLSPEQMAKFEEYERKRYEARVRAVIQMTVAEIEELTPLVGDQRQALLELLTAQKYPRRVPEGIDAFVGYIVLARTDEEKMQTILDKHQWKVVQDIQAQYEDYARSVVW